MPRLTRSHFLTGATIAFGALAVGLISTHAQQPSYKVYVTNEASGDLSIIDPIKQEVIGNAKLGKRPRGIHASLDRKFLYVALSGSPFAPPGTDESKLPPPDRSADGIGVYDIAQNKVTKVLISGPDPEQFDLSKDGKLLYISNEDAAKTTIIDIAAGKIVKEIKVGEEPEGVTTSPNGKFVYVTAEDSGEVNVIDTATQKLLKRVKVGKRPRSVAFLPDSSRAYVTAENDGTVAVMNARTHVFSSVIRLGESGIVKPMGLAMSPDGGTLYVSTGSFKKVFVVDTKTNKVTGDFEVGQRPWGIAVSPDGKLLFTANGPSGDVSVVDLATKTVLKKIKVADRPWGVIVVPQ